MTASASTSPAGPRGSARAPRRRGTALALAAAASVAFLTACSPQEQSGATLAVDVRIEVCDGSTCTLARLPEATVMWRLGGTEHVATTDETGASSITVPENGLGTGTVTWGSLENSFQLNVAPGEDFSSSVVLAPRALVDRDAP